jgi:O-antigen ligase
MLAVASDRFSLPVPGTDINIRLEFVIGGILAAWWPVRLVPGGGLAEKLRRAGVIELCLAGWLAVGVISSLWFSPAPHENLRLALVQAGLLGLYGVAFLLLGSARAVVWSALIWVLVGTGVAALGLTAALAYTLFGLTEGITLSVEGNYEAGIFTITSKVHSTMWEPNIFGSFCLATGLLAFTLSLAPVQAFRRSRWQGFFSVAVVLAACGVVISMTRTAWLAGVLLAVGAMLIALRLRITSLHRLAWGLVLPMLAGTALGLVVGFSMPAVIWEAGGGQSYTPAQVEQILRDALAHPDTARQVPGSISRGSALGNRAEGVVHPETATSYVGRRQIYMAALQKWLQHPLLGWGVGAYGVIIEKNGWLPNLELRVLLDTGVVGLLLLALAGGAAVLRAGRALLVPPARWDSLHFALFGLLLGSAGLLIAYQLTDGTWLGFTWVYFAMLVAGGRFAGSEGA